ncbi:MAG: hypothetical protein IPJ41_11225 [Phycisphaerales bacterium]|nr:hypothetical protein [Phycisphaerales bacterium]
MKKRLFWSVWGFVPAAALVVHLGPGQEWLRRDDAARAVRVALAAERDGNWSEAADSFARAGDALPESARAERARLALSEAKARVRAGQLVEGQDQLENLLDAELTRPSPDAGMVRQLRHELGTTAYWGAWLMRLDGATPDEWLLEAETSRQHFRLLAEDALAPSEADTSKKNVEAVIRLEQMDLSELRALPLPKNCPNCSKGLCQKKRDQRLSKCKKPGNKDAREQIKSDSAGDALKRGSGS